MWPRLLEQLVAMLPPASRMPPMANGFSSITRESDLSQSMAIESISGSVQKEINGINETFGGIVQQLSDQKKQIGDLQQALEAAETHRLTQTNQLEWLTGGMSSLGVWLKFGITIVILLLGVLIALTMQVFLSH